MRLTRVNTLVIAISPERVQLIEAIRHTLSSAFAEHNSTLTLEQLHHLRIIAAAQFPALVDAVNEATHTWLPPVGPNGLLLAG